MINISDRLKTVAQLVLKEQSNGIIDVGCDHALLDIYLLQNNNNLRIVASDLREKPLENAKKNIEKYSFLNKIELKLQDGLGILDDYIDTIIIAGMGEDTIRDILIKGKRYLKQYLLLCSILKQIKRIVISSNSKFPLVRKEINSLGFVINDERIVYEEDKYYIIMEFIKGNKEYNNEELFFGPILLNNKDEMFYKYYNYIKSVDEKILGSLPIEHDKRNNIEEEIKMLDKYLI